MKKFIFLLILAATPLLGRASHIVGGEFELIHLKDQPYRYRLNLILYFDSLNGSPGAKDPSATVRFFRMRDNFKMMDLVLPLSEESSVQYTQKACSHGELKTRKLIYTADVTLSPNQFNDELGYYVAWERCCRNYSISNVYSEDPNNGGQFYAGQTFYLEFPPVIKDGVPFVDSTPTLFPPLNDYACPLRPYYTDFGGKDDDGDSLVYSLVTPLSTKTNEALPTGGTHPRPYPEVRWRPNYGITHVMNGSPDLKITQRGFLTVTPAAVQGLFVFAVKVEEFRNKVKIGETRRDFQMLVVDQCARAIPPQILGKTLSEPGYTHDNFMSVSFASGITDTQRCIKVQVSDDDSKAMYDGVEKVKIKAIALNFNKDVSKLVTSPEPVILVNGSVAEFTICFDQCPYFIGAPFRIGIVAMDDACSLPLTDTLKIDVTVIPPVNTRPHFVSPAANPFVKALNEGTQDSWPWQVVDDENDELIVSVLTNGFVLKDAGMVFNNQHQVAGEADGMLSWDAYCDIYDFTKRTNFAVTIQVEDKDQCNITDPAKQIFNLAVINLPPNRDPIIDTDLTTNPAERRITGLTRRINESLSFTITGLDPDHDFLSMTSAGTDFDIAAYGVSLSPAAASGIEPVTTQFRWDIKCNTTDLTKKDFFDFQFIVIDNKNKCRFYRTDTVDVEVKILPPLNRAPQLSMINQNATQTTLSGNSMSITRGPAINLMLRGTDADTTPEQDNLKLKLVSVNGNVKPDGYTFADITGKSPLVSSFTWTPDCSIFKDDVYENEYSFTFKLSDDHCLTAQNDSIQFKLKVKDIAANESHFIPPNFFSPNGDNINDYFAMEAKDGVTGELRNILPNDNCASRFESVRIYNRWGNLVFQSTDRDFRWYGPGESAGVYYYHINFTQREYRGSLSLRY
jgi:hypothetical protein